MVISLERCVDLHMAQLMPLPLTVSCFSKIQIGFTFLVPAYPGSSGQRAVKRSCVCVCVCTVMCDMSKLHTVSSLFRAVFVIFKLSLVFVMLSFQTWVVIVLADDCFSWLCG